MTAWLVINLHVIITFNNVILQSMRSELHMQAQIAHLGPNSRMMLLWGNANNNRTKSWVFLPALHGGNQQTCLQGNSCHAIQLQNMMQACARHAFVLNVHILYSIHLTTWRQTELSCKQLWFPGCGDKKNPRFCSVGGLSLGLKKKCLFAVTEDKN